MPEYRCRICGTFYRAFEAHGFIYSPCCGAMMDSVPDDYTPETYL